MDSPLSSAVSISNMSSEASNINHTSSDDADSIVPKLNSELLFEPGDGDMDLIVNGTRFETHRYLIKRFKKWRDIEPKRCPGSSLSVNGTASPSDFSRMFKVLYSTTLQGPSEFDTLTLVSTLHIATEHEYPVLRDYAIRHLERAELSAIKRVEIARKFNIPTWIEPAYVELCDRNEAITEEEANTLGMTALVRIANIREKEQRRRGMEIGIDLEREAVEPDDSNINKLNEEVTGGVLSVCEESPKEIIRPVQPARPKSKKFKKIAKLGVRRTGGITEAETNPEGKYRSLSIAFEGSFRWP
ncbi:unnamed protein product [Rhizoctonia solani]|uniref:BTB domain-containing protein n=1 Tax=Rhizoctonia solani TaxID=456999 RepID=A0A8H3A910_9AGAM|nr:unnamed protein product [Rhizoctonia solani]